MKLLHVDSSIRGESSVSRQLSAAVVEGWRAAVPGLEVLRRDLAAEPIPHLDARQLPAVKPGLLPVEAEPDAESRAAIALGAAALEEFLAADVVVVGAPMYNFGIPSQLKAWIDRLAVAGKTFAYGEAGPKGLAGGKRVIVASSRGGLYGPDTPQAAVDFQEPYLRAVFGFFGIDAVSFVRAEGLAFGEEAQKAALEAALGSVPELVAA